MPAGRGPLRTAKPAPAPAVADAAALTSTDATGHLAIPTEADYNALRADVAALRATLNATLAALRAGGVMAP